MMKIVHIARPLSGVGVYIQLLCKHIDSKKFSNVVICNTSEDIIIPKDKNGKKIKIYHANIKREINLYNDIKTLLVIIKILKIEKPDIMHCHSAKSGILGRLAGFLLRIKVLYTPHAYSYLSSRSKIYKIIFKNIEKLFGVLPSKILTCSKSEYNRATVDLKINSNKVYLWNNSIEGNLVLKKTNYKLPKRFICTIGRPSFQKNSELLINSIKKVKEEIEDIYLIILGVGYFSPNLKSVKRLISKNNLDKNILLIPWLDRSETLAILKNSILYVSTSRYEGLPYSVIEAMALKKPCILTDVDGNRDLVVNNYNGFLVSQNELKISQKIIHLLKDESLIHKMGENARLKFEKMYNINKNIKKLEEIYLSS